MSVSASSRARAIRFVFVALALTCLLVARPSHASVKAFDGVWSSLDSNATAPHNRRAYAAVYDDALDQYVLFGGYTWQLSPSSDGYYNDVWGLTLGDTPAWAQMNPTGMLPGPRNAVQWGYDAARQRLLMFGGYGYYSGDYTLAYLDDIWQLSLDGSPAWTQLTAAGTTPQGRLAGAAVYDPLRQRFVGFGGTRGLPVDTWELDLSGDPTWVTVTTDSAGPPGSYGMTAIYDPVRDRMVIFGGSTSDAYFGVKNDVWALDLSVDVPTWHPLAPTGTPPSARRSGTAIYDPLRDRMIVFGGWDNLTDGPQSFLNDVWALSFTDLNWTQLAPGGPAPPGRDGQAASYDPLGDRMVVYGGWTTNDMLGDTQFLTWSQPTTAPTMTASSTSDPAHAQVTWQVSNVTGNHAGVYRRSTGKPWASIGTADRDVSGAVHYTDTAVTAGQSYDYQIVVSSQRGEVFGGQTTVPVPTQGVYVSPNPGVTFALEPVRPNPVRDQLGVSFSLPTDAPARLDLIDIAGRRVSSRDLAAFGVGRHQLSLGSAARYAPGLYFMRLEQGGRTQTTRVVIER